MTMQTPGPHSAWTRANGTRPASRPARVRDALDASLRVRTIKPKPGPVQVVQCECGEQTIARSADAPTLAGWTVGEWPAEPQEFGKVSGVCRKCSRAREMAQS